jgi:hypothetical protein
MSKQKLQLLPHKAANKVTALKQTFHLVSRQSHLLALLSTALF